MGDLPIARLNGDWLSTNELIEFLSGREQLDVHFGSVEYDADLDEVHPKEFENSFEEDPQVLFVPAEYAGYGPINLLEFFAEAVKTELPSNLEEFVRSIIGKAWDPWRSEENVVVGSVNGSDIFREVIRFEKDAESAA